MAKFKKEILPKLRKFSHAMILPREHKSDFNDMPDSITCNTGEKIILGSDE